MRLRTTGMVMCTAFALHAGCGSDESHDRTGALGSQLPWVEQAILAPADGAHAGHHVAISGDTAVVAASDGAYVFVRQGVTWSEQQKLPVAEGASGVAVSGDTAIVSAPGTAVAFVRNAGVWTEQQILTPSDELDDGYGACGLISHCVAISGETALVARKRLGPGGFAAVYVFERSGSVWTEQQRLEPNDISAQSYFGQSISLSGDTALIGAPNDNYNNDIQGSTGSALVFARDGDLWTEQQELVASHPSYHSRFGFSVSIADDRAVVGALCEGAYDPQVCGYASGAAYVFARTGSVWTEQQRLQPEPLQELQSYGLDVAVSDNRVFVSSGEPAEIYTYSMNQGA